MKLLNLCCGANRVLSEEWVNLDYLFPILAEGTPERNNLLNEKNYVEHDVLSGPLPFEDDTFSGILASHCAEHWDCQQTAKVMQECRRVLQPGGVLMVSVPDASYFRKVYAEDTPENAIRLFGEPIHLPDGENTFFGYGLWNRFHLQLFTEDSMWCCITRAGFTKVFSADFKTQPERFNPCPVDWFPRGTIGELFRKIYALSGILNRLPFSLVMVGVKE